MESSTIPPKRYKLPLSIANCDPNLGLGPAFNISSLLSDFRMFLSDISFLVSIPTVLEMVNAPSSTTLVVPSSFNFRFCTASSISWSCSTWNLNIFFVKLTFHLIISWKKNRTIKKKIKNFVKLILHYLVFTIVSSVILSFLVGSFFPDSSSLFQVALSFSIITEYRSLKKFPGISSSSSSSSWQMRKKIRHIHK